MDLSDFLSLDTNNILFDLLRRRNKVKENLPQALSIQKRKFLMSINKTTEETFSEEAEQMVKDVTSKHGLRQNGCYKVLSMYCSLQWDDSKATPHVKDKIQKHTSFKLLKYLKCVQKVFLYYSGVCVLNEIEAMEYVLIHARQFGDPAKTIFERDDDRCSHNNENRETETSAVDLPPLPESKFMNRAGKLIADLRLEYNETKFRTLNANATYIILLMLRRIIKKESEFSDAFKRIHTHDSYVKLCPSPLDNQLPLCDTRNVVESHLKDCAYLAIDAYLNTNDEKTKRVLRTTCIQFMEWNGLQLPKLFFKVVELYGIDAGTLWDHLCYEDMAVALMNFAKEYHTQYEMLKADPSKTQRWFPFCRVLHGDYHKDLSVNADNKRVCIVLAYLVDMKMGYGQSTVRHSHWVKSAPFRAAYEERAKKIYEKLN